jgi:hypothetical protein
MYFQKLILLLFLSMLLPSGGNMAYSQENKKYFIIRVVDQSTGRGVPMVELRTQSERLYITDSNGIIAFDDEDLMGQPVTFKLFSHGYEGSSEDGLVLNVKKGESTTIPIIRMNIAERLYRVTGQDIYGESRKAGIPFPIRHQALNGKVMGQDTFIEAFYNGRLYWFWGDTFVPAGFNGGASGAISELPQKGGLDPDKGIDLTYFVNTDGQSKAMCAVPGPGLKWIDWLVVLKDKNMKEQLYAKYSVAQTLDKAYERGIAKFNDSLEAFEPVVRIEKWLDKVHSSGHPQRILQGNDEYIYIFDRYGIERVRADVNDLINPESYEHFTCFEKGSMYTNSSEKIERDENNNVIYSWKKATEAMAPSKQNRLVSDGKLSPEECWFRPVDIVTGKEVSLVISSVFWNSFRKKWIMLAQEYFGGVWFLEADTPTGPWLYARKVAEHRNYDFYNVGQHPLFDKENGRLIYFEGTYTLGFSGAKTPTPLYNYNQVMYRLALDDSRLSLPSPVYIVRQSMGKESYMMRPSADSSAMWGNIKSIPFYALSSSSGRKDVIPVYARETKKGTILTTSFIKKSRLLFFALPSDTINKDQGSLRDPMKIQAFLYEYRNEQTGELFYSTDPVLPVNNLIRAGKPLCRVWKNPSRVMALDFTAVPVQ